MYRVWMYVPNTAFSIESEGPAYTLYLMDHILYVQYIVPIAWMAT